MKRIHFMYVLIILLSIWSLKSHGSCFFSFFLFKAIRLVLWCWSQDCVEWFWARGLWSFALHDGGSNDAKCPDFWWRVSMIE